MWETKSVAKMCVVVLCLHVCVVVMQMLVLVSMIVGGSGGGGGGVFLGVKAPITSWWGYVVVLFLCV